VIFPALACQLRVEARRVPLAANAGGDIHDALITPFGVRLLIGDVMGSGLPASETGAQVLAAWRELAMSESSLPGIAVRLHTLISRSEHPERFVTALLAGFGCGGADMVCCGHPPPLLLRGGTASYVETFPAPPLGLLDLADGWCKKFTVPFGSGDKLLMYTDGVTEARDTSGTYFPLAESAIAAMRTDTATGAEVATQGDTDRLLDGVLDSLRAHIAGRQSDDILMLLAAR
jgi:serine phosphatase RsbU (regulator of sigma subunit)